MLVNRISRIQRFSTSIHKYSTRVQPTYPFSKLRAYPFLISPEDAIVEMAPYASLFCSGDNFWESLGALFLPGFGFRPLKIVPVYFPGWFIDAEVSVEVNLWDKPYKVSGAAHASYLPGSDFRVLSWISYRPRDPHLYNSDSPVPFTEELTHQHGVDVTCIPYTISPFVGFDLARSATDPIRLVKNENISLVPSSIRTGMFAAYPVLIPLYLAQYEYTFAEQKIWRTFAMEATTSMGRIWTEKLYSTEVELVPQWGDLNVHCLRGTPDPFFEFKDSNSNPSEPSPDIYTMNAWLKNVMLTPGIQQKLAKESGVLTSDADPRIRPFTIKERKDVHRWLALSKELLSMNHIREVLLLPVAEEERNSESVESIERAIVEIKARRDAATPRWWREWQHTSQQAE